MEGVLQGFVAKHTGHQAGDTLIMQARMGRKSSPTRMPQAVFDFRWYLQVPNQAPFNIPIRVPNEFIIYDNIK